MEAVSSPWGAREPIRLGMVGGGRGAFIGAAHRLAARLDGRYRLLAGALSSDPERARASATDLGLDPERGYGDWREMLDAERAREDGIEAVAIVTTNDAHFAPAAAFLKAGVHVICDKPMTSTLEDAIRLEAIARESAALFALTHNYTGYPLIRQARAMVEAGRLGAIRVAQIEYAQDWLSRAIEREGHKQAAWRTDPARAGAGGSIGDIGTHAFNLAEFVTGLEIEAVAAELSAFAPGRTLDDDASVLLRFRRRGAAPAARGALWSSQIATGCENGLRLRVYGEKAGLEWRQEEPNVLWFAPAGEPARRMTRNGAEAWPEAQNVCRVPPGHPEGYVEGFANLYAEAALVIEALRRGESAPTHLLPGAREGLRGLRFVDACVRSSAANAAWAAIDG